MGTSIVTQYGNSNQGKINLPRKNHNGVRILSGRMGAFDNSTVKTFRAMIEVASGEFDAVRPIFANGSPSVTYTVAGCNARALANFTDDPVATSPTTVTVPSSGVVPVSPYVLRRSYLAGSWLDLNSVPRDDGGSGAIICFDAYVSTASSITVLGNGGSDDFSTWATRTNRKWIFRHNDGDCVTTPANFVSTDNQIQSPIVGVQYTSKGQVITVMGVGDSIVDGRASIVGEGFGVPACEEAQSTTGITYEWANCGWAGTKTANHRYYLSDLVTAGVTPDIAVFFVGSPNDFLAPLLSSYIDTAKLNTAAIRRSCSDNSVYPIALTVLPVNASVRNYDATDTLRVAYNAESLVATGFPILDFATPVSGITDGDGQVLYGTGMALDNIHPSATANAILKKVLANTLIKFK